MKLRPRYSLLTLLLLTAGIAVGIKLWRGPHREIVPVTPTAEQQIILDRLIYFQVFQKDYAPVVTELEYLNRGSERAYLGVKSYSTSDCQIPVIASELKPQFRTIPCAHPYPIDQEYLDLWARALKQASLSATALEQANAEHVVCWLYNPKHTRQVSSLYLVPARKRSPWFDNSTNWPYFLSNRRRLYIFHGLTQGYGIELKPIELREIEDPEFRDFVATELACIPAP